MLKWFADRLAQTGKEVRKDQRGFTLIELLVVVIIIGILAAIAIPTFLSQRDSAQESAAESDLRNLATAAQSYSADNEGSYDFANGTVDSSHELADDYDFNRTDGVDVEIVDADDDGFDATATSENGTEFEYESDGEGQVQEVSP